VSASSRREPKPTILFQGEQLTWDGTTHRASNTLPSCSILTGADLGREGVLSRHPGRSRVTDDQAGFSNVVTSVLPISVLASDDSGPYAGLLASDGVDIKFFSGGAWYTVTDDIGISASNVWSMTQFGRFIFGVNGVDKPFMLENYGAAGNWNALEMGLRAPSGSWSVSATTGGDLVPGGTYQVRIRYWDVGTNTRSNFHELTKTVTLDAENLGTGHSDENAISVTLTGLSNRPPRIGTLDKIEVARTMADRYLYFVEKTVVKGAGSFPNTTLTLSDLELGSDPMSVVMTKDMYKSLPLQCRMVIAYENVLFQAGV